MISLPIHKLETKFNRGAQIDTAKILTAMNQTARCMKMCATTNTSICTNITATK